MPKFTRLSPHLIVWDSLLIVPVIGLILFGLVGLFSASVVDSVLASSFFRQLIWLTLSVFVVWVFRWVHPRVFSDYAYFFYGVLIFLLLLTYFMPAIGGGMRWLVIGGVQLQPSEFGKVLLVLALARYLSDIEKKLDQFLYVLTPVGLALLPAMIIMGQPDLGTAIIFVSVALAMMYWAGVSTFHLFIIIAPVISLIAGFNYYAFSVWMLLVAFVLFFSKSRLLHSVLNFGINALFGTMAPMIWNKIQPYQQRRILTLLDATSDPQGAGYQVLQSRTAIGSGGVFGKGLGEGTQTHLRFLPVTDTDFIIAVIGEELGFLAILVILILFGWLFLRLIDRAATTQNRHASLVIIGLGTILLMHVFVNMGMATGMMPVTGLPLPFMSYGGSFLLTCCMIIGMVHYILAVEP